MKKIFLLVFLSLFLISSKLPAQTSLQAGDIAIVGFNSDLSSAVFGFVCLTTIAQSTEINFTDCGWSNSLGGFTNSNNDGGLTWTADRVYAPGEVIYYSGTSGNWSQLLMGTNTTSFSLGNQGDEIFVFQGSYTVPTLIYGVYFASKSWSTGNIAPGDNKKSNLPSDLSDPNFNVVVGQVDNGYYSGGPLPPSQLLQAISTTTNWTASNTPYDLPSLVGGSLPVELTSFIASSIDNTVNLKWTTATEVKNFGWDIERSQSNKVWEKVGFVQGAGNSNSPKDYSYKDDNLNIGSYLYRLKQIDTDGKYAYSKVVEVNIGTLINGYSLSQNYPNPFNPSTRISFVFEKSTIASLKVYNTIGQEVAILYHGLVDGGRQYNLTFDASKLSGGVYFYELTGGGKEEVKKMLLLK